MFNNNRRRRKFRSNIKPFRRRHNGEGHRNKNLNPMINGHVRSGPIKGPHHIQKLIEKYTNLAKEALSTGDRILSENYFQHADHFSRMNLTNTAVNDKDKSMNVDTNVEIKKEENVEIKKEESSPDNTNSKSDNNIQDKINKE